jgi:regulator of nucleoside diphosphate kinase
MRDRPIVVTQLDAKMLRALLAGRMGSGRDHEHLEELDFELERALVLDPVEVPSNVVTMQTRVRVLDLSNAERRVFVLVYPADANVGANRISVLAPLGTAVLGYREGDEVEWVMPGGPRRIRIERVFQPADDAAGGAGGSFCASAPVWRSPLM